METQRNREEREPVKELEKVFVIPTRAGEELHGTVVEIDGEVRADLRYYTKGQTKDGKKIGMLARKRGLAVFPKHYRDFEGGVQKLGRAILKYQKAEHEQAA